ncbi:hypothetical protein RND71_006786 [Anisodus tanguticus]|uniref:RING-type domain-containing protein n=1 Tax=Anisodus tanguticus TaxID=243964 RepID=A0AAE1SSL1_9SOLA|nr:hypothetical protein RND71_006786 [Anisodus tanguticus]
MGLYSENFHWYFTLSVRTLLISFIFSIPIFLLLAFLLFRYVRRRSGQLVVDDEEPRGQIRQGDDHEFVISTKEHLGLDAKTISALPIFMFKLSLLKNNVKKLNNYMESECSICLGCYEDEEIVKMMPKCHHGFHSPCLDKWLGNCSTRPICRSSG